MDYSAYPFLKNTYDLYLEGSRRYRSAKVDTANARMARYLYTKYLGNAGGIVAQTRIASSYGLLQILYSTAVGDERYPEDKLPEDLNITDIGLQVSLKREERILRTNLMLIKENASRSNWSTGYEMGFNLLLYAVWNTSDDYGTRVLVLSQNYLPR